MNAKELAEKGEALKNNTEEGSFGLEYVKLSDYGQWTALSSIYLETNYPTHNATKRFIDLVKNPDTRRKESFNELVGIIKGVSDWEESTQEINTGPTLREMLDKR